MIFLIEVIF